MNAIHIDRLHFKGRESQRRLLADDLERAAWPHLRDREYLFIRRLQALTSAGRLAYSLAEQARELRRTAVSGWRDDADRWWAVYFADDAELLACLSRDLLQNRYRWYWRQWAGLFEMPMADGLSNCWRQHRYLIPALITHLARREQLRRFCRQLSETQARALCEAVFPSWPELQRLAAAAGGDAHPVDLPPAWFAPWQTALAGARWPAGVLELAALLVVRQWQPLKQRAAELAPPYLGVLRQLQAVSAGPAINLESDIHETGDDRSRVEALQLAAESQAVIDNAPANRGQPPTAVPAIQAPAVSAGEQAAGMRAGSGPAVLPVAARAVVASMADPTGTAAPAANQPEPLANAVWVAPNRLFTQQGGMFYLLNFLNLPQVLEALLSEPATRDYPSAWGWLWQLALAMEWDVEPELENLFAYFCGYAEPARLRQLPAMPQIQDLLQWGRQRYGAALFRRDILAVPALLEADASHVDVFYALDSVNLDLRRVGLDIDPGWLPWLGKVVKFHYGGLPLI
ncbi:hypothetical protein NP590_06290 [Methylomonas sp. SURF-2]|uniref:Uncharacterized protein n=1 Tax=Methylomonas subterranea TaxID=2952225 RepID=A0ABT1TE18_9GAMM|nr:hypothetical protein [Methylomonas sp. SURF-2]MCQ8103707.1 hypothetical protein [Methylomonas sp. SURF-2]